MGGGHASEPNDELDQKLLYFRDTVRRIVSDSHNNNPYPLESWEFIGPYLLYVLDLGAESLRNIRLHTEIFNGEPVTSLLFSGSAREEDMSSRYGYSDLIADLPPDLILEEPDLPPFRHQLFKNGKTPTTGAPIRIGFQIGNRRLAPDIIRYQMYFRNLYSLGILDQIQNRSSDNRFVYMEIGAGYGCLAYQLMRRYQSRMCTVIVDLPLMLIFTACYLAVNLPDLNIFIFDPDTPDVRPDINKHDVILIPNYRLDIIEDIGGIDLAFNSLSMQEMSDAQVIDYLDFLQRHVRGGFYYHGTTVMYEKETRDITQGIAAMIAERFDIHPGLQFFAGSAWEKARGGAHGWPVTLPYEFYATPKGKSYSLPETAKLRVGLTDGTWGDVVLNADQIYPISQTTETNGNRPRRQNLPKRIIRRLLRMTGSVR